MIKENNFSNKVELEYHTDDCGMFTIQRKWILECCKNGRLNGVRVMPNNPDLHQFMEQIMAYKKDIAVTVYLNLIERFSLCPHSQIPALTDREGRRKVSFGKI